MITPKKLDLINCVTFAIFFKDGFCFI